MDAIEKASKGMAEMKKSNKRLKQISQSESTYFRLADRYRAISFYPNDSIRKNIGISI